MKAILFSISLMIVSCLQIKASILIAIKKGKWHQESSWNLDRIPNSADTIIIPDGINIMVTTHVRILKMKSREGKLIIFGTLKLNKNVSIIINDHSWINCLENGKLIGNRGSKIIVNEQLKFSFKKMNERYQLIANYPKVMIDRLSIRLNDTLLTDFSIRNSDSITYMEVQHSYDGKSWSLIDRVKAFPNEANECRFISLKKVTRQNNADFVKLIGYSNTGKPVLFNVCQFKHNTKKMENRNKLKTIPKSIFLFGVTSLGSRFAKIMNNF